jgi:hypothetical protein
MIKTTTNHDIPIAITTTTDDCGEFCYTVHSVVEVTPAEAEVLRKYL